MNTVYLSAFLDSASGVNLDKVVEPLGIMRKEAVRSTGYARFEGTPGTIVDISTIIKTVDDTPIEFKTDTAISLADLITNGEFTTNTNDWTAENAATIASVSKKLDFTSGGTHEVLVGNTLTGEISGATAVVSAIVLISGSWAGEDAAGTFYFSTQTGEFEAETLKEGLNLNVCDVATDSTNSGGKSGNAMLVICNGSDNPLGKQTIAVTENLFYDLSVFINAGTATTYNIDVYDDTNADYIYRSGDLVESNGDWSTEVSQHIKIPNGCSSISVRLIHRATAADETTMLFDSCELVRVAPITAIDAGTDGNVAAETIVALGSPITDITSVNNPASTSDGSEKETDVALRIRTKQSIGAGGKATLNAIVAAILAIDNVSSALIEENDTAIDYSNLLINSEFDSDTRNWYAGNSATISSEIGGKDGNCLKVLEAGHADPYAYQHCVVTPAEVYTLTVCIKKGDEATYYVRVWDNDGAAWIDDVGADTGEANALDWDISRVKTFTVPAGCYSVEVRLYQVCANGALTYILFDSSSLHLDPAGLPPHSVRISVEGGTDNDIAQALLDTVAGGIETFGDANGSAELDNGQSFTRYFTRPDQILITIVATITSDDTYGGDTAVETAIIDYIGGTDSDGALHDGLSVGDDAIFYEVVSAIMSVTGVTNATGVTLNGGTADISIASNEVAYTTIAVVTIS